MRTPIKCILLDDELPGLTYLKILCEQIPGLEVVKAFNRVDNFLAEISTLQYDLCILDIEMPGMNGLQVANLLQDKPVIFITAYKEYAVEAFDIDAVDYIRKPFRKERLQLAIQKAEKRIDQNRINNKFITLNTDKGKTLLFFDQLEYVSTSGSDSRDKVAWLSDNTQITLKNISFEKLLAQLPDEEFVRINRNELIAVRAVKLFSSDQITTNIFRNGETLTLGLSEIYKNAFLKLVQR